MERKIKSEGVSKISVSKFKDYFLEEGFCSEDFVMSPMVRFKTMTGAPRVIEGMTVGVICNGTAKVVINDRAFELRPNSLFLLREESKITSFKCTKACTGYFATYSTAFIDSMKVDTSKPSSRRASVLVENSPLSQRRHAAARISSPRCVAR